MDVHRVMHLAQKGCTLIWAAPSLGRDSHFVDAMRQGSSPPRQMRGQS